MRRERNSRTRFLLVTSVFRSVELRAVMSLVTFLLGTAVTAAQTPALPRLAPDNQRSTGGEDDGWHLFPNWAAGEGRLLPHDGRLRPRTLLAWAGQERRLVDGTEDKPLESDRPDFTEASSTIGMRRLQIEMGYTFVKDDEGDTHASSQSYPETLYRIGLFCEWFEVRVGWNFGINTFDDNLVSSTFSGGRDLYLGAKIGLTEQDGWLPEMAIIPQMNVPTGDSEQSDGEVEPGVNWLYGWDINEFYSVGGSTQVNRRLDDTDAYYSEFAQSLTINYALTEKLGGYTEWFALMPAGSVSELPKQYFDGGFVYRVHNNLQLDIRAGVGLNQPADDFFAGLGSVVRF
jgi:hypothetical protein